MPFDPHTPRIAFALETHFGLEVSILDIHQHKIRVRIQPLTLRVNDRACLLLILEDRQQACRRQAIADGERCGFTPREVDVWELRLQGHSYEDISRNLWITENTVKKHMKSILAKRRLSDDDTAIAS